MNYRISHTCIQKQIGDLVFYRIPLFENAGNVVAFFTTRLGGSSTIPELQSMNLGFSKDGEKVENVRTNYEKLCRAFSLIPENLVLTKQEHTDIILTDAHMHKGMGWNEPVSIIADSMITNAEDCILVKFTADCVPVLLFDPVKRVIADVHDGWRGTVKRLAEKTVQRMCFDYGCDPRDILAAIGPSIGPCCFEIGSDVASVFIEGFDPFYTFPTNPNKYHSNLWSCNVQQLMESGITADHIAVANICTYCNNQLFYSYRREGKNTGSLGAFISL